MGSEEQLSVVGELPGVLGPTNEVSPRSERQVFDKASYSHDERSEESYERSESRTVLSTSSYMAGVTVPVFVFCREG